MPFTETISRDGLLAARMAAPTFTRGNNRTLPESLPALLE
jgi:hypothetical protein